MSVPEGEPDFELQATTSVCDPTRRRTFRTEYLRKLYSDDCNSSKTLPYPDNVGVIAFSQTTQSSIGTRAVLNAKNQFSIRQFGQSERKVEAQIKKHLGAPLVDDLMLAFLANRI